jgi:plastocyanin
MDHKKGSEKGKIMVNRTRNRLSWLVPLAAMLCGVPVRAETSEPSSPEEMRREIRQLRAQVQALRAAITDALDYDRLRGNALKGALSGATSENARESAPELPAKPVAGRSGPASHRPPAPVAEPMGAVRGQVEVPPGEPVAYVYVENIRGPAVKGPKVKIEQLNKSFVPSWAVVQRGTVVEFPNKDNIYHNVFSVSSGNTFDLGLYNSSEEKAYTFEEAGAADIYCNIHPQMAASVLVVPNRFFTKVKADGSFEIPDVPGGKRKVVAWSPGSRLSSEWVEVSPGSSARVKLTLERKTPGHRNKQGRPYGSYE